MDGRMEEQRGRVEARDSSEAGNFTNLLDILVFWMERVYPVRWSRHRRVNWCFVFSFWPLGSWWFRRVRGQRGER